jgi:hypothetical protein
MAAWPFAAKSTSLSGDLAAETVATALALLSALNPGSTPWSLSLTNAIGEPIMDRQDSAPIATVEAARI